MTIQLGPGKLYARGEGKVPRICPVCHSKDGRVGFALDPGLRSLRGWLCYNCNYFPGKDPKHCRMTAILNQRESSGPIFYDD